jgi:protein-S-isoprenylcysteine O-methyltransferase Ste14
MSGPVTVLVLLMLLATTIVAFYWYFRHRRSEMELRRYEGDHYERARGRLSRLIGRQGESRPPGSDDRPD